MQDFRFSKPANRAVFLQSIARIEAHYAAKQAAKFVPPVHVNEAIECDDPMASGASVGHPLITSFHLVGPIGVIERESPFDGHSWPLLRDGFWDAVADCIDAPLYLPMGCASGAYSGARFPRDYGRMVRREPLFLGV